jgi:ATP-binding cassette subfamily C protein LapB
LNRDHPARHQQVVDAFEWLSSRLLGQVDAATAVAAQARGDELRQRLTAALSGDSSGEGMQRAYEILCTAIGFERPTWQSQPTEHGFPSLALIPAMGPRWIYGRGKQGTWLVEGPGGRERIAQWPQKSRFTPLSREPAAAPPTTAKEVFRSCIAAQRSQILQAAFATVLATVLALGTSLYAMQVYDRVVGARSVPTLLVLTTGVLLALLLELVLKLTRAHIMDTTASEVDEHCAHAVVSRLLAIRLDQSKGGIGRTASRVKGYETVRSYSLALLTFLAIDAPMALLFLSAMLLIGGPALAAIPLAFMTATAAVGLVSAKRLQRAAAGYQEAASRRHGLLVEALDAAESIKATGARWDMLGRWRELSDTANRRSLRIKQLGDLTSHVSTTLQQMGYIAIVGTGAWLAVSNSGLTTGAIVACSILSGRVRAPIGMIPALMVQRAQAQVALRDLEALFDLQSDNDGVDRPLAPSSLRGSFRLDAVQLLHPRQSSGLTLSSLRIAPGERVAIVGPVGSGKTTLLRLLSGLVKPTQGQVLLDGLDIQHIDGDRRAELVGYLPQLSKLIAGTLRDNLLLGKAAVSEQVLLDACEATGLAELIRSRVEGLSTPIGEGGQNLSGGQVQLIALTRLLLRSPNVWLLDEPTASMDEATEIRCVRALARSVRPGQTLVLATHRPAALQLVDRLIVLTSRGVLLDGPKDEVLARLRSATSAPTVRESRPRETQP